MKKLSIFFIIVLGVTFMSCNRKTTLKGRVINPITGEGNEGATISASKTTLELPGGYKTVEQTTSDANGDFLLEFKKSASDIGVSTGNYYNIGWYQNGEIQPGYYLPVDKGKTMKADFYAVPYGEYRIKINNINCQGATDTIIINQTNQVNSFLGIDWVLEGCSGYTTAWDKVPMGTIHTKYTVVRSGVSNTYEVDFEVQPNQQNEQVIDY